MGNIATTGSGHFLLNLDGTKCGFVHSVFGGGIRADVVNDPVGKAYFVKKHIGGIKYEDFSLEVDLNIGKQLTEWIAASWKGNFARKNGSIVITDFQFQARSEREFENALLTEVSIPTLDAASKSPGLLTIKFAPEITRTKKASGKITPDTTKNQKSWIASNFKLEIPGLDCTKVTKIDSFAVKQMVQAAKVGETRTPVLEPGKVDFPNLRITIPDAASSTWAKWFDDFVIKGSATDDKEKNGTLTFLTPDKKSAIAHISFFNLGIFALTQGDLAATDAIRTVIAELYCERMEFALG